VNLVKLYFAINTWRHSNQGETLKWSVKTIILHCETYVYYACETPSFGFTLDIACDRSALKFLEIRKPSWKQIAGVHYNFEKSTGNFI